MKRKTKIYRFSWNWRKSITFMSSSDQDHMFAHSGILEDFQHDCSTLRWESKSDKTNLTLSPKQKYTLSR